jgi:hypothetical protein
MNICHTSALNERFRRHMPAGSPLSHPHRMIIIRNPDERASATAAHEPAAAPIGPWPKP